MNFPLVVNIILSFRIFMQSTQLSIVLSFFISSRKCITSSLLLYKDETVALFSCFPPVLMINMLFIEYFSINKSIEYRFTAKFILQFLFHGMFIIQISHSFRKLIDLKMVISSKDEVIYAKTFYQIIIIVMQFD